MLMTLKNSVKPLFMVCFFAAMPLASAQASITLGSTRLVYHEADDGLAFQLTNREKLPYLVQSWITPALDSQNTSSSTKSAVPFVVTPPLFRMNAGEKNVLNIIKSSGSLPEDRESVFYLNVKAIPGRGEKTVSNLTIAVNSTLKMFYRPASLTDDNVPAAWNQLVFSQNKGILNIKNPSPFYITFFSLSADNKKIAFNNNAMISPFGTQSYPLPSPHISSVSWSVISDTAQPSEQKNKMLP
jgi:fimbrial chaperone protein